LPSNPHVYSDFFVFYIQLIVIYMNALLSLFSAPIKHTLVMLAGACLIVVTITYLLVAETPGIGFHLMLETMFFALGVMVMGGWWQIEKKKLLSRIRALEKPSQCKLNYSLIDPDKTLTLKETHILELIVNGKSNKEICQQLYIEPSTLKSHINHLYKKLGIKTRKEAFWRDK
jgi:DNA-binding CsgD family transcriptional regulator